MPKGNIEQFNSGADELHPSEIGANAYREVGRREGTLGREMGDYYKQSVDAVGEPVAKAIDEHNAMQDISHGAATAAVITNNLHQEWNKIANDPSNLHDDTIQKKFMEDTIEPLLQQYQDGFSTEKGKQWGMNSADSLRTHFWDTTSGDMARRAGAAVKQDLITQANQLSNTVIDNPSAIPQALEQLQQYGDAAKANHAERLTTDQVDRINDVVKDQQNNIVKSGLMGLANKNPDAATQEINSGVYEKYMTGPEHEQLLQYAANGKLARTIAANQARDAQQYKDQQVNAQTTKSFFSDMTTGNIPSATTVFSSKGLSPQQRTDFIGKEGILTLPPSVLRSPEYGHGFTATLEGLQQGNEVTPAGLTKGVLMNRTNLAEAITPAGAARLQEIQDKMKTPEGAYEVQTQNAVLTDLRNQLMVGGKYATDTNGKEIFSRMQSSFYTLWDKEIQAGKTPAQLSDPESKDYIGGAFMNLKRSPAQALSDVANAKPGEGTDYLSQLQAAKKVELPAADKRVVGQTYPTARGPMVWQEGGWAQPKAKGQ